MHITTELTPSFSVILTAGIGNKCSLLGIIIISIFAFSVVSSTVRLNSLPVTYDDSSAAALGTCSSTGSTASCPGSGTPLGDGVLGSGALDNSQVFAWNSDVVIDYQFTGGSSNPPHLVNLYFYNEPTASSAVGLPIIRLTFDTNPVHYVFLGNQDVKESDSQYRSISLAITTAISDLMFSTFSISLSFLNTNLNWVAMSEVELCTEEGESIFVCMEFHFHQCKHLPVVISILPCSYSPK